MKKGLRALIFMFALGLAFLFMSADKISAQDYYGEGNVLVAVDMSAYAENEEAVCPEGWMGTLLWGSDAPTGVSTREGFKNHTYSVPDDISVKKAPGYDIETAYEVGQKLILPVFAGDSDIAHCVGWVPRSSFPEEIFEDGGLRLLYSPDYMEEFKGETYYYTHFEKVGENEYRPLMDFLEIECVYVGEFSTVWQYTGTIWSNRTGFDAAQYGEAVNLLESELKFFIDTCDESYVIQKEVFGDPGFEDAFGDRDGKAAYVVIDTYSFEWENAAYYNSQNTYLCGFDSLMIKAKFMRASLNEEYGYSDSYLESLLIHELNHYILGGLSEHDDNSWSYWMGEAFAQYAVPMVSQRAGKIIDGHIVDLNNEYCPRLMGTPGIVWSYDETGYYPMLLQTAYALGGGFLQFIERMTTGKSDGRLWTEYFSVNMPNVSIMPAEVDRFLTEKTGEDLKYWMARYMASFVLNNDVWFNSADEYGKITGAFSSEVSGAYAVKGGGTTYVFTNYPGGRIAVTGADDDLYFFAFTLDIPDPDHAVGISSADDLAKIGKEHSHPLNGNYVLTKDIDLGGEKNPWEPIGGKKQAFRGKFDGQGYTISGLWSVDENKEGAGLFGWMEGDSLVENLTVEGVVTGRQNVGGIVGRIGSGTVKNCTSHVTVSGELSTGGISGQCWENAVVENCTSSGSISGICRTGGILGEIMEGIITGCSSDAIVSGEDTTGGITGFAYRLSASDLAFSGEVSGKICVGGIMGYNEESHVSNCENSGRITGDSYVGGIEGWVTAYCLTEKCHNLGIVRGTEMVGGIVGFINGADLSACKNDQTGVPAVGEAYSYSYSFNRKGDATVLSRRSSLGTTKDKIEVFSWDGIDHPIVAIGKNALSDQKKLKAVTIGKNVKKIGSEAFAGDKKLRIIELTASVTKIGKDAFKGIAKDAVFRIEASEKDFKRIVKLIKKSGVGKNVVFERIDPDPIT